MVFYSDKIIQKFVNGTGQPFYKDWKLDAAVEDAWKKRKLRGHIEYVFQQTPLLKKLLRAYKAQSEQLEKAEGYAHEVVAGLMKEQAEGRMDAEVVFLRLLCVGLKMRLSFMDVWENVEPIILYAREGPVRQHKEVIQTKHGQREALVYDHPGYVGVSLYASKETKERLGVA